MLRVSMGYKMSWDRPTDRLIELWKRVIAKAREKGYLHPEEFDPPLYTSKKLTRAVGTTHTAFRKNWDGETVWAQAVVITDAYKYVDDDNMILRTMSHEMAHVIFPRHYHDYLWSRCARDIGSEWGETGGRFCSSSDTKIIEEIQQKIGIKPRPQYKYQLYCPHCGKVFTKYKTKCASLTRPRWRCSACHTTLGYIDLATNEFHEIKK